MPPPAPHHHNTLTAISRAPRASRLVGPHTVVGLVGEDEAAGAGDEIAGAFSAEEELVANGRVRVVEVAVLAQTRAHGLGRLWGGKE